ncbi:MAG: hypothetical protein ACK42C_08270, partial [Aquificaceae bacterium]
YGSLKPPEAMDFKVALRLEREKRKRLLKVAVLEAFLMLVLLGLYFYQPLKNTEYQTFSAGIPVKIVEDVGIKKLSDELRSHQLTIEGPYEGDVFILKGEESRVREFLSKSKNLRALD